MDLSFQEHRVEARPPADEERSNSCPPLAAHKSHSLSPFDGASTKSDPMFDVNVHREVVVGVCAMNKKTLAPPMQSILSRMRQHVNIRIVIFSDETILKLPVAEWPVCDCLIAFFSKGFPLQKAIEYANLHKPMLFNDLEVQYTLQDREKVYEVLKSNGIRVPRYSILKRSSSNGRSGNGRARVVDESAHSTTVTTVPVPSKSTTDIVTDDDLKETDDTIEVNGQVFHKPFVEKPISAEDHNVHIYFPSDYGGGCQKLFRKIGNRSSSYTIESSMRREGSYIYEEFLATNGVDVKVYTVGPDYAHAEARKCPSLDGIVVRDSEGIEKRYPVILTSEEKLIARKVCLAFKQTVCGFDLLRANGKSFVCDVNGFSFVKKSEKYYDDCAQILLEMIFQSIAPEYFPCIPPSVEYIAEDVPVPIPKTNNNLQQLRCVIGIIRHGDRTPKQKMKMIVTHEKFYRLFEESRRKPEVTQVKIKEPMKLQRLLDITCSLLESSEEVEEETHKLQQLKAVLQMYGHFSGINRKVQFKVVDCRSTAANPTKGLLLILKWGGELTPAGERQAEELGRAFRCMYPGGEGEYASLPGSGFLRLHSTFRHDLKVYASDEGRVQMTAAAFTRGLLDLEGSLASVRTHLVKRDQNATDLLDTSNGAEKTMTRVKHRLHTLMHSPEDFTEDSVNELAPTRGETLLRAVRNISNPRKACEHLYQLITNLTDEIRKLKAKNALCDLYHEETPQMMLQRWAKLQKDFKSSKGSFDISKIPDIYDCIKYDLLHNGKVGLINGYAVFQAVKYIADIVIPQEYGITKDDKVDIAKTVCNPLLRKIRSDLNHVISDESSDINHRLHPRLSQHIVITPSRHVRTRLYFTSESHIHGMFNILRYGDLIEDNEVRNERWKSFSSSPELDFLSQIVFLLFEDQSKPLDCPNRYYLDMHIGAGMKTRQSMVEMGRNLALRTEEKNMQSPSFLKRLPVTGAISIKPTPPTARKNSEPTLQSPPEETDYMLVPDLSSAVDEHEEKQSPPTFVKRLPVSVNITPSPTRGKRLSLGYTEASLQSMGEPGFVLAAELSSTVEPLTHVDTYPISKMFDFLSDNIWSNSLSHAQKLS